MDRSSEKLNVVDAVAEALDANAFAPEHEFCTVMASYRNRARENARRAIESLRALGWTPPRESVTDGHEDHEEDMK